MIGSLPPKYLRHKFYNILYVDDVAELTEKLKLSDKIIYRVYYKGEEIRLVDEKLDKTYVTIDALEKFEETINKHIALVRKELQEQKIYENRKEGSGLAVFRSRYHLSILRVAAWADGYKVFFDLFPRTGKGVIAVPVFSFSKFIRKYNGFNEYSKAHELVLRLSDVISYLDSQPYSWNNVYEKLVKRKKRGLARPETIEVVREHTNIVVRRFGESVLSYVEGLVHASIALSQKDVYTAEQLYRVATSIVRNHLLEAGFPQPRIKF